MNGQTSRFLAKFLSAFIPIKSWRKKVRHILMNPFGTLPAIFAEIKLKRDAVAGFKGNEGLVLAVGSSHCAYGFDPSVIDGFAVFNLGANSQDLYTMYHLVHYWIKYADAISKVIVFVDVFHRGSCIAKTSAKHICASYNYLYGIEYPGVKDIGKWVKKCRAFDWTHIINTNSFTNGYLKPPELALFGLGNAEERVRAHMHEHNRQCSQYPWLVKLVSLAKSRAIETVLVVPPLRKAYLQLLPIDLAKELCELNLSVKILDYSHDEDFCDDDFHDFDHLNDVGAKKLARKINHDM